MYPYHNIIKKRIREGELVSFVHADEYHGIKDVILLVFSTYPHVRIIRNHRFLEYLPFLVNHDNMDKLPKIRKLYQDIFHDSDVYCDAVFLDKYKIENLRWVSDESGDISSFAFLLDKKLSITGFEYDTVFLSGVGTIERARGKGYMKQLLKNCFIEGYEKGIPMFTLSPANENYYLSAGFVTVRKGEKVSNQIRSPFLKTVKVESGEEYFELYSKNLNMYSVSVPKTVAELESLIRIFSVEGGGVFKVYDQDRYVGYYVYDGEVSHEYDIDTHYFGGLNVKNYIDYGTGESRFMARILRPDIILEKLKLESNEKIYITVVDDFLDKADNFVLFTENNQTIVEKSAEKGEIINVIDLTNWYFGIKNQKCRNLFGYDRVCKIGLFDMYL